MGRGNHVGMTADNRKYNVMEALHHSNVHLRAVYSYFVMKALHHYDVINNHSPTYLSPTSTLPVSISTVS